MRLSTPSHRIETAFTVVLTLCAVVLTGLAIRREMSSRQRSPGDISPEYTPGWEALDRGGKRLGTPEGKLRIVEFVDFQCSYCAEFALALDSFLLQYPGQVSVAVRNFPLSMHGNAAIAARAAECSAQQGAFEQFYRGVFNQPDSVWSFQPASLGGLFGVPDTSRFGLCVESTWARESVRADSLAGVRLGVSGTPLVIMNGWVFPGTPTTSDLVRIVERERLAP